MNDMAKIFWNGRSQAVRLPKEYRFDSAEVSIRREGAKVILEPAPHPGTGGVSDEDALGADAAHQIERLRALIEEGVASADAGEWDVEEIKRVARGEVATGEE